MWEETDKDLHGSSGHWSRGCGEMFLGTKGWGREWGVSWRKQHWSWAITGFGNDLWEVRKV